MKKIKKAEAATEPTTDAKPGFSSLSKMIAEAINGRFYGKGKGPREMRDEAYKKNAAYKRAEDELAPHLQALGAVSLWRSKQNSRIVTNKESRKFDLQTLPNADEWECFTQLSSQLYVPKGAEEVEMEDGIHLEIENMTQEQIQRSMVFTRKQTKSLAAKAQYQADVLEYRKVMRVPADMTLKDWAESLQAKTSETIASKA